MSDDHSLARGRGKGTVYQNMHDVPSKADRDSGRRDHREGVHGDTLYPPLRRDRAPRKVVHQVTPRMGNLAE